jgi:hypothetical protein
MLVVAGSLLHIFDNADFSLFQSIYSKLLSYHTAITKIIAIIKFLDYFSQLVLFISLNRDNIVTPF